MAFETNVFGNVFEYGTGDVFGNVFEFDVPNEPAEGWQVKAERRTWDAKANSRTWKVKAIQRIWKEGECP